MWPCGRCRCDADGENGDSWHIEGVVEKTRTCARKLVTPQSDYFITLYHHYRRGHFALAGGVTDQPAPYLEAMQELDQWIKAANND